MNIRKSKTEECDVNVFLDAIDKEENLKEASIQVDMQIDELRNISKDLTDYFRRLDNARKSVEQYCTISNKIMIDGRTAANTITDSINQAIEDTKHITVKANLCSEALKSISDFSQALAESEKAVLQAHGEKQKSLFQKYHYEFCHMLDENQGVWLSPSMCKVLLWIFLPCVVITVVVIVLAISMALGK